MKSQLEADGLFTVDLKSTEWVSTRRTARQTSTRSYQLGWFPDYSDADNYLTPFFLPEEQLPGQNHYSDPEVTELILQQAVEPDPAARTAAIEDIQARVGATCSRPCRCCRARRSRSPGPDVDGRRPSTRRSSSASHADQGLVTQLESPVQLSGAAR